MELTAAPSEPLRFIGFPLAAWAFALRNWSAMLLALYVAFWLQLESPSTAATCVGILALPTRGQMLQKSVYRIGGTVIGLIASFAIAGLFNEVRDLLLAASAAWISLCVFAAGLSDGNRAYGAVLSGYTVAIVTVAQIDSPQDVFSAGVNRGAAIMIGILAIAFISALVHTPAIFPSLLNKLEAAHGRVRSFAATTLRRGASDPVEVAALFGEITALRSDITLLPLELINGDTRSAAARTGIASLVREIAAARVAAGALASIGTPVEETRSDLEAAMHAGSGEGASDLLKRIGDILATPGLDPPQLLAASAGIVLLERDRQAATAWQDMRSGRGRRHGPRLPIWRSREAAAHSAVRNFTAFLVTAALFVAFSSWPATSGSLDAFAAVLAISATARSPLGVAFGALVAAPVTALAAGITEFALLDGADQFPLLAMGMAPTIIGASLIVMSGKPKLVPIGTFILILFPIMLSPSNPQSYDAQAFLSSNLLIVVSIVLLFLCLATILPTSDTLRRNWSMRSSLDEFRRATLGKSGYQVSSAAFRDADRIAQLGKLKGESKQAHEVHLRRALRLSDLASCSRRIDDLLADPEAATPDESLRIRSALATLDPVRLQAAAQAILNRLQGLNGLPAAPRQAVAELVLVATLIERYSAELEEAPCRPTLSEKTDDGPVS